MPSKEQLEDLNDQLTAENRDLNERLAGLSALEDENQRLRESLRQSEQQKAHAAQMLNSLSAAQAGMEQLFRTKEETSIQRLEIEAKQIAKKSAAVEEWKGKLTTWKDELDRRDKDYNSKLKQAESRLMQQQRDMSAAQHTIEVYQSREAEWSAERGALKAEIRRLQKLPGWYKATQRVGGWLSNYPWFWVGIVGVYFLALMVNEVVSLVLGWIWPSSEPPPI